MSDTKDFSKDNLNENLFALGLNFNAIDAKTRRAYKSFTPPTLNEIVTHGSYSNETHPILLEMIESEDVAKKLYGAILLFEIDEDKATETLRELLQSDTPIKVQNQIGHGSVEVSVKYLAESFLQTKNIRRGFLEKKEISNSWLLSIQRETEKKQSKDNENQNFPVFETFWEDKKDTNLRRDLIKQLNHFANDKIISKRFYVAFLLNELEVSAGDEILQNLLIEDSMIPILMGDIIQELPAKLIAAQMLNGESFDIGEHSNKNYLELHEKIINKLFSFFRR